MIQPDLSLGRAAELRRAFDGMFAAPAVRPTEGIERFLAIRIAKNKYALRLGEIAGLAPARKLVPLPSAMPAMLGLAGVRGNLVPVYDLATLIGNESEENSRWLVICGGTHVAALAFAELDGYMELPSFALHSIGQEEGARQHIRQMLSVSDGARGVIGIPSLLETIKERIGVVGTIEER